MYVRIDSMNIWKNRKLQYQNIWTNDLEDGMATLGMTLDLGHILDSCANCFCTLNEQDNNNNVEEKSVLSSLSGLSISINPMF